MYAYTCISATVTAIMDIPCRSASFVLVLDLREFTVTALLVQNSPPKCNSVMPVLT